MPYQSSSQLVEKGATQKFHRIRMNAALLIERSE
jgi:hypothetical protein